ncbi:MAG: hypothetical protein Q7V05_04930 [Methanoregula sp.]|nr:hypothetical protein [Methanoregula sp.]
MSWKHHCLKSSCPSRPDAGAACPLPDGFFNIAGIIPSPIMHLGMEREGICVSELMGFILLLLWDLNKYVAIVIGKEILQTETGTGTAGAGNTRPDRTPVNPAGTYPVTGWGHGRKYCLYGLRFLHSLPLVLSKTPVNPSVWFVWKRGYYCAMIAKIRQESPSPNGCQSPWN